MSKSTHHCEVARVVAPVLTPRTSTRLFPRTGQQDMKLLPAGVSKPGPHPRDVEPSQELLVADGDAMPSRADVLLPPGRSHSPRKSQLPDDVHDQECCCLHCLSQKTLSLAHLSCPAPLTHFTKGRSSGHDGPESEWTASCCARSQELRFCYRMSTASASPLSECPVSQFLQCAAGAVGDSPLHTIPGPHCQPETRFLETEGSAAAKTFVSPALRPPPRPRPDTVAISRFRSLLAVGPSTTGEGLVTGAGMS